MEAEDGSAGMGLSLPPWSQSGEQPHLAVITGMGVVKDMSLEMAGLCSRDLLSPFHWDLTENQTQPMPPSQGVSAGELGTETTTDGEKCRVPP